SNDLCARAARAVRESRLRNSHPYNRLRAREEDKRRRTWNHIYEKMIFTPYELAACGAPQRRSIYISSLEAHVEVLHTQLFEMGFWPVAYDELESYRGLHSKTTKSLVSGLQYDATEDVQKLVELEKA
ncbi:hypothetical protein FISHEDRAFT_13639, partial [Fistulina hepatica ATCC 64428]